MEQSRRRRCTGGLLFLLVIALHPILPGLSAAFQQQPGITDLFYQMKCEEIIKQLENTEFDRLPRDHQLTFIESAVLTGQMEMARERMDSISPALQKNPEILQTQALICLASGRFGDAEKIIEEVIVLRENSLKALLWKVMLCLYNREPERARRAFQQLSSSHPQARTTPLVYVVGIEVYTACGDMKALGDHYKFHLKYGNVANKTSRQAIKANSRFYMKIKPKNLYRVEGEAKDFSLRMGKQSNSSYHRIINYNSDSKNYQIILDTGNAVGWFIHDRDLKKCLTTREGGRVLTSIGSQSGLFDGYRILTSQVDFKEFRLVNYPGIYVPKPNRNFYDANLNPLFIKNRVVYLDFVDNRFILKSQESHREFISGLNPEKIDQLRWFGYESAYIEVSVFGRKGLAMIETGAEDVALNLNFARKLNLGMTAKIRYLANGSKYQYYITTPVEIKFGNHLLVRKSTQAWSLHRFRKRITGLTPDIILGPQAFAQDFIVVFDPFGSQINLIRRNGNSTASQ